MVTLAATPETKSEVADERPGPNSVIREGGKIAEKLVRVLYVVRNRVRFLIGLFCFLLGLF
jgi:hypothetical protein